jgi:Cytochrome P460
MDCITVAHFRAGARFEIVVPNVGRLARQIGGIQMSRTSIAASVLVAASMMGAGALATASGKTVRLDADSVAKLAIMAQLEKSEGVTVRQAGGAVEKVDDAKGNLHVPADYRTKFRYIGSWAVAADSGSGSKEMHTVYASPGAVEGYLKTGHFEDGAVLVKEVSEAKTEDMTTGTVSHVVNIKGWFVMVRDSKNKAHPGNPLWGDGWGWSWFDFGNTTKTTSTNYKNDCMGCHVPATPTDFIYVQGYPSLKKQ